MSPGESAAAAAAAGCRSGLAGGGGRGGGAAVGGGREELVEEEALESLESGRVMSSMLSPNSMVLLANFWMRSLRGGRREGGGHPTIIAGISFHLRDHS